MARRTASRYRLRVVSAAAAVCQYRSHACCMQRSRKSEDGSPPFLCLYVDSVCVQIWIHLIHTTHGPVIVGDHKWLVDLHSLVSSPGPTTGCSNRMETHTVRHNAHYAVVIPTNVNEASLVICSIVVSAASCLLHVLNALKWTVFNVVDLIVPVPLAVRMSTSFNDVKRLSNVRWEAPIP